MNQINNNIEERRVSFPVAKLLKEAGFDCKVFGTRNSDSPFSHLESAVQRPTQQLAIDWVRLNFGIHIKEYWFYIEPKPSTKIKWSFNVDYIGDREKFVFLKDFDFRYNTTEEAKEAALEYCLTKLILKNDRGI